MSIARRDLLGGIAGLGSLWAVRSMAKPKPLRVGVVGGGIVGASIAMHLARAGAKVTLFEKAGPALGTTQNSFAWVNAFTSNANYRDLRIQSMLAYRELDGPLALKIIWAGYLHWPAPPRNRRPCVKRRASSHTRLIRCAASPPKISPRETHW